MTRPEQYKDASTLETYTGRAILYIERELSGIWTSREPPTRSCVRAKNPRWRPFGKLARVTELLWIRALEEARERLKILQSPVAGATAVEELQEQVEKLSMALAEARAREGEQLIHLSRLSRERADLHAERAKLLGGRRWRCHAPCGSAMPAGTLNVRTGIHQVSRSGVGAGEYLAETGSAGSALGYPCAPAARPDTVGFFCGKLAPRASVNSFARVRSLDLRRPLRAGIRQSIPGLLSACGTRNGQRPRGVASVCRATLPAAYIARPRHQEALWHHHLDVARRRIGSEFLNL